MKQLLILITLMFSLGLASYSEALDTEELSGMSATAFGLNLQERDPNHFILDEVVAGWKDGYSESESPRFSREEIIQRMQIVGMRIRGKYAADLSERSDMEELSYMAGFLYGHGLRQAQIIGIDQARFAQALQAAYDEARPNMYSMDEIREQYVPYIRDIVATYKVNQSQEKRK